MRKLVIWLTAKDCGRYQPPNSYQQTYLCSVHGRLLHEDILAAAWTLLNANDEQAS